jgi:UDP-hydrolysing UDP-N-acetyl-D-glucosamine 2-epimerase
VAHVQGGEVTGSSDEKVRHAVTKLSDIHLVATERAAAYVIRMGENPRFVFRTGGPDIDLAAEIARDPNVDFDPFERYGGVGERFPLDDGYAIVIQHPVTTEYEQSREQITKTLEAMDALGLPTLWFWPNVDAGSDGTSKGIRVFRETVSPSRIHFFRNMPPEDFLRLLNQCRVIVGNSSVAIREGSFLGIPAVNIGDRQGGREHGSNIVHVDYDKRQIADAVTSQLSVTRYPSEQIYGDGNAGQRISEALASCELTIEKRLRY